MSKDRGARITSVVMFEKELISCHRNGGADSHGLAQNGWEGSMPRVWRGGNLIKKDN